MSDTNLPKFLDDSSDNNEDYEFTIQVEDNPSDFGSKSINQPEWLYQRLEVIFVAYKYSKDLTPIYDHYSLRMFYTL